MSTPHIFSHVGTSTPLMVPRSWPPAIFAHGQRLAVDGVPKGCRVRLTFSSALQG
jgi:hypothetical protein